jgi:hypothetical protein
VPMMILQELIVGASAAMVAQATAFPPPPPPPSSFEALEPTVGEQHLVVRCGVENLEVLYRWRDRSNEVVSFRFWRKSLSAEGLAHLNTWLRELRSPAVIMTWCNPFGADVIFQEAYTRLSGDRKRIRINFAYGRLSRVSA